MQGISSTDVQAWINQYLRVAWDGAEGKAHCPLHADAHESLTVNSEKVVWHCHAGCGGGKLSELAGKCGWAWPFNGQFGRNGDKQQPTYYVYQDDAGNETFRKKRYYIDGRKCFAVEHRENGHYVKGRAGKPQLYRLPDLLAALGRGKPVFVTEGEKDVEGLRSWKLVAITNDTGGGGGKWQNEHSRYFPKEAKVYLLGDADISGQAHMQAVGRALTARGCVVKVVDLGYTITPNHGRDISDWIAEGHTREELLELCKQAKPFQDCAAPQVSEPACSIAQDIHETDLGNARRLVRLHGADLHYCHPWRQWLVWDGKRWARDTSGEVYRRAKATVAEIYREASQETDDNRRKALASHAVRSELGARIEAMVRLAESEPAIPVQPEELDRNPFVFNCHNGTVDVATGSFREHRREDLVRRVAPIDYEPGADCPRWRQFLHEILAGDDLLEVFLQQAVGYTLTGDTREQCLFFLFGTGANGKSTFVETVAALLGDYATKTRSETLLEKRDSGAIPNDIAALAGARLVYAVESQAGRQLAEGLVKEMCGGDTLSARFLHAEYFTFTPTFKIFLATNHRPTIRGADHAIWRRIRLVPFNVKIPEERQDKMLKAKLREELTGILNWALEGASDWLRNGLSLPEAVIAATEEYRSRMDVLADFLADRCQVNVPDTVSAADLYAAYKSWAEAGGERVLSKRAFGMGLEERDFVRERGRDGIRYLGLKLCL